MPGTIPPNDLPPGATSDDLDEVLTPEMSDEEAARARPICEAPSSLLAALPKGKGGRPRLPAPKVQVSLRIDPDVLASYRSTGPGWQSLINETLRRGAARLK